MPRVKAPTFKKPDALKKLPGLSKAQRELPAPTVELTPIRVEQRVDETLEMLVRELGDRQLAKKVLKLKQQFPDGTFPELVTYEWLQRHGTRFEYQFTVLGGRQIRGGQVLDFVVDRGYDVLVWEIQGQYWHTRPGKIQADEAERMALLGVEILGKKVGGVVEIWDTRIMDKYKRSPAFDAAMSGIEVGQ
jgi:hypothetical protein